ncbi:N-acetylneuraminate lyase [Anaerosolibacter carboniphilus]|uniref:N-acetylneuraminate lyase n=1 Tax=Anaerosolibacter carboniphilus TaxID=1417629 RepID=A0A841KLR6_9FIRM|nr:N-acetylneuraminate lyase [Anaerosolibacter carboniphilus]MBB6214387.1 N-acetylneuraminate lyase [Anaerosolibacter carboniphilus]
MNGLSLDMKGIFAASITPFDKQNKINDRVLLALMERNIHEGVTGFFIGGSSAECFLLSQEERMRIFEIAAEYKNITKLIAHVGAISTDEAIAYGLKAKKLGYEVISATAPYYYKFSPKAIVQYYYDIYENVGLPIILYNFPGNTGVEFDLQNEDMKALFRSDAIVGVKHTNLNIYQLERIKNIKKELIMYNGFDEVLVAGLAIGADGAIGSTFNFMYPHYRKIQEAFEAFKHEEARILQTKANNIMEALCRVGLISAIKYALTLQGIDAGAPRKPFFELDTTQKQYIEEILNLNLVR